MTLPIVNRGTAKAFNYADPVSPKGYGVAEEGSYWIVRNPTSGTGLAGHAAPTAFDATKAFFQIKNGETDGSRYYLDYIRLIFTAAGAGATDMHYDFVTDTIARYTSGGTALTPTNVNSGDTAQICNATIYGGAVLCPAAGANVRRLGGGIIRTVVPVVGDTYAFNFCAGDHAAGGMIVGGSAVMNGVFNHHPIVLGGGHTFNMHHWSSSQSGAHSFEIECGFWKR